MMEPSSWIGIPKAWRKLTHEQRLVIVETAPDFAATVQSGEVELCELERGSTTEVWIKAARDRCQPGDGDWRALDALLDDYRLHADTGTPLDQPVSGPYPDRTPADDKRLARSFHETYDPSLTIAVDTEPSSIDSERKTVREQIQSVLNVQGRGGNWNYNSYMRGMFNGIELCRAIMDGDGPKYRDSPPEGYIEDRAPVMPG